MPPISDASNIAHGAIGFDLAAQMRRALLFAARDDATLQDRIDCAELALAIGWNDAARALYDIVFVLTGFSPARLDWQQETAARTGLWPDEAGRMAATRPSPAGRFALTAAIADIGALIATFSDLPPLPADRGELVADLDDNISLVAVDAPTPAPAVPTFAALGGACARLRTLLAQPADDATPDAMRDLADLLAELKRTSMPRHPFDVRAQVSDLEALVTMVVANDVRRFLLRNRPLAFAPFGSAGLLHAVARCREGAVGPYLSNVPMLIRGPADILALIQLAAPGDAEARDRWTVLLSGYLSADALLDVVDELGDTGITTPLWGLLLVAIRRAGLSRDRGPLWRIRDAALDNDDFALAAAAQRVIALWAIDDRTEWRILADIHATNGDPASAMEALMHARAIAPDDHATRDRIEWVGQGTVDAMQIRGGFATPKARQQLRMLRRQSRQQSRTDSLAGLS